MYNRNILVSTKKETPCVSIVRVTHTEICAALCTWNEPRFWDWVTNQAWENNNINHMQLYDIELNTAKHHTQTLFIISPYTHTKKTETQTSTPTQPHFYTIYRYVLPFIYVSHCVSYRRTRVSHTLSKIKWFYLKKNKNQLTYTNLAATFLFLYSSVYVCVLH